MPASPGTFLVYAPTEGIFEMRKTLAILAALFAMGLSGQAFAHASMTMSKPADGAVVIGTVETLEIGFDDPVVLTSLKLTMNGKDVPIDVDRRGEAATSISVPLPDIHPGKYEVKWGVVSEEDGHPLTGSFSFTLREHTN